MAYALPGHRCAAAALLVALLVSPRLGLSASTRDIGLERATSTIAPAALAIVVVDVASGRVLLERGAVDRALPPGSTFKIVDVLAAATHPELLRRPFTCRGRAQADNGMTSIRCAAHAHGPLDLEAALACSCNTYFAALGEALGTQALLDAARNAGLGQQDGSLPPSTALAALVADGEGVRVTARELAALLRRIALGLDRHEKPLLDPILLGRLRAGLRQAVTDGTAAPAQMSIPVAGKTGTANLGRGTVGWFAGYAPADAPTVVVVVARRNVIGSQSARLARSLFEAYFHGTRTSTKQ